MDVFYKLLGMATWKAVKFYVHHNVPTRKIAAAGVLGTVGVLAIVAASKKNHEGS
jgi:hypothetical protein